MALRDGVLYFTIFGVFVNLPIKLHYYFVFHLISGIK